jgi:hypothetical protein
MEPSLAGPWCRVYGATSRSGYLLGTAGLAAGGARPCLLDQIAGQNCRPMLSQEDKIRLIHQYRSALLNHMFDGSVGGLLSRSRVISGLLVCLPRKT